MEDFRSAGIVAEPVTDWKSFFGKGRSTWKSVDCANRKNHREDLVNTSRKLHPQVEFNEKKIFFPPCPHEISTPRRQILLTFTGFYFLYFLRLLRYDAIVFSPATLWKNLYTYLYIVVTARPHCMLARTASSWSLEKSAPVVAFIFHWVYFALFYLFFDIVASCWLLLCDTDFFFKSVV